MKNIKTSLEQCIVNYVDKMINLQKDPELYKYTIDRLVDVLYELIFEPAMSEINFEEENNKNEHFIGASHMFDHLDDFMNNIKIIDRYIYNKVSNKKTKLYKTGQIVELEEDKKTSYLGDEFLLKKGSKAIIGTGGYLHFYRGDQCCIPLPANATVEGIDVDGLVQYLSDIFLCKYAKELKECDVSQEELEAELYYRLHHIMW